MRADYKLPLTLKCSSKFKYTRYLKRVACSFLLILLTILLLNFTSYQKNNNRSVQHQISKINSAELISSQIANTFIVEHPIKSIKPTNINITENWQAIIIRPGDSLHKIFSKIGITNNILQDILNISALKKDLNSLYPQQKLYFLFNDNNKVEFKELKLIISPTKILHIKHTAQGLQYAYQNKEIITKLKYSSSKITGGSLFATAKSIGLNQKLIMQIANIFAWDIDFALDIRENDRFKILYEEKYIDNTKIGTGKIIAVEFINNGKSHQAIYYANKEQSGYFDPNGFSLQKTFLRTPVKFTRISSHFSNARHHPILHQIRAHKGVDYAAPIGTPIKATGNGKITFIGKKGGYGQAIEISHGYQYSTFYAHLSKFAKDIKKGSTVKQGQIIGYVGKTGLASGPHLHYEFRVNGIHRNPLTVKLPHSMPIDKKYQTTFKTYANKMIALLNNNSMKQISKNGTLQ